MCRCVKKPRLLGLFYASILHVLNKDDDVYHIINCLVPDNNTQDFVKKDQVHPDTFVKLYHEEI